VGTAKSPLSGLDAFRMSRRDEPRECVNSGEARVSRSDAILPVRFQMI